MITEERVTSKHEQMASKRPLTVSVSELWDYLQIPKSTSRIRTSTSKHSICERIQITTYYHTDRALQLRSRLTVLTVQYNAADRAMNEKNNEKKKKPSRCEGWMAHFSQPSPTTSCTFPIDLWDLLHLLHRTAVNLSPKSNALSDLALSTWNSRPRPQSRFQIFRLMGPYYAWNNWRPWAQTYRYNLAVSGEIWAH
jgi:hypothetical protein